MLSVSTSIKPALKMLMKLTPGLKGICYIESQAFNTQNSRLELVDQHPELHSRKSRFRIFVRILNIRTPNLSDLSFVDFQHKMKYSFKNTYLKFKYVFTVYVHFSLLL